MQPKTLYEQVQEQLPNPPNDTWLLVLLTLNNHTTLMEVAVPKRGEMRVRQHRQGNLYDRYRFTKARELVYEGVYLFAGNVYGERIKLREMAECSPAQCSVLKNVRT